MDIFKNDYNYLQRKYYKVTCDIYLIKKEEIDNFYVKKEFYENRIFIRFNFFLNTKKITWLSWLITVASFIKKYK